MAKRIINRNGGVVTEVIGLDKVTRRFRDRLGRFLMGALDGNYLAGQLILQQANELVPVDSGMLRATGFVSKKGLIVTIGYTADYAMIVHEMVEYVHGSDYNSKYAHQIAVGATYTHTPTGETRVYHTRRPQEQAKFLEVAVRQNTLKARNVIRRAVVNRLLSSPNTVSGWSAGLLTSVIKRVISESTKEQKKGK